MKARTTTIESIVTRKPGATMAAQTVAGSPKPEPIKKVISYVLQWLLILAVIAGLYFGGRFMNVTLPTLHLTWWQVVGLAFAFAFTWVYIFKWGSVKPFNCVTCLSGWFALIIGFWCFRFWAFGLMPVAMTVGALYSEIRMRWL